MSESVPKCSCAWCFVLFYSSFDILIEKVFNLEKEIARVLMGYYSKGKEKTLRFKRKDEKLNLGRKPQMRQIVENHAQK